MLRKIQRRRRGPCAGSCSKHVRFVPVDVDVGEMEAPLFLLHTKSGAHREGGDDFSARELAGPVERAGPCWMSCVCSDERAPILDPDHYVTYLGRRG